MVRFVGLLLWKIASGIGASLLLIPLAIAWVILGIVLFVMQTWEEANA